MEADVEDPEGHDVHPERVGSEVVVVEDLLSVAEAGRAWLHVSAACYWNMDKETMVFYQVFYTHTSDRALHFGSTMSTSVLHATRIWKKRCFISSILYAGMDRA